MPREDDFHKRATIGVITAQPKEYAALEAVLIDAKPWTAPGTGAGRRYRLTKVGSHIVAVALLPDTGNNSAAIRATTLLQHCPNVRHLIMCGIAGGVPFPGVPEHDVRLGDIVVSDRNGVIQYDFVKEHPSGEIEHRYPPRPPSAKLLEATRYLEAERIKGRCPWEDYIPLFTHLENASRPPDNHDARGQPINYPPDPSRRQGWPRVFYGPIAAANRLLKNPAYRDALRQQFGVKAIEMEGSGIADATWFEDKSGYLVIRGICDCCDENKGDTWQGYAAGVAAAYLRALLESMPSESSLLEPIDSADSMLSGETTPRPLTGHEWEKKYLHWLIQEVETISRQWHRLPPEPTEAHTKEPQGQQGFRSLCRARLFRYFQTDYKLNPALRDLELSVRAGFGKRVKIKDLAKELRKFKRIVVLGDPGSGKSVCLLQLAYDLAQRGLRQARPERLPVLLFMDTYDGWKDRAAREPTPILEFLAQNLRAHESIRQDPQAHPLLAFASNLEDLLREGRLTCIFDALDEMPQDSYQERYRELKQFMSYWGGIHERNRFIYCRSLDYDPAFDVDEVIIDPFDRWRIRRFLRNNLPTEVADILYDRIVEDESLEEMVSNPFFLQALTYINGPSFGRGWRVPKTRGELIRVFVETLLQREAEEKQPKALATVGGRDALFRFLADLGFVLQQRREGGTSARTDELDEVWRRHFSWWKLIVIARRARILGRRGEESDERVDTVPPELNPPVRIEFVHHRIQEFFAADELARGLEQGEQIERYLEDIWWQETVILAFGIVQDPRFLLSRMLGQHPKTNRWIEQVTCQARTPIPIEAIKPTTSTNTTESSRN